MKNILSFCESILALFCLVLLAACGEPVRDVSRDPSPAVDGQFPGLESAASYAVRVKAMIKTRPPLTTTSSSAEFSFSCTPRPCTFKCNLDGGGWKRCKSPKTYGRLAEAAHIFQVKATSRSGAISKPAKYRWIVYATSPIDIWLPITTSGAPTERLYHSAVWTGTEMIIWGGFSHSDNCALLTGGRYDPPTDPWAGTYPNGPVPSSRFYNSTDWAEVNQKMMVWGGWDYFLSFATGGIYDPLSDSWAETSTGNAPRARSRHRAVWTGTEMIIWGGFYEDDADIHFLNTGLQYEPNGDVWTPISHINAPSGRPCHTAVWTGQIMMVWGGKVFNKFLNTGGRYFR